MKNKIINKIKELQEIAKETGLKVKPDTFLENAIKIVISDNISEQKDRRVSQIHNSKPLNSNEPITPKQKDFLIREGYQGNVDKLTKIEASVLIKEALAGKYKKAEDDY